MHLLDPDDVDALLRRDPAMLARLRAEARRRWLERAPSRFVGHLDVWGPLVLDPPRPRDPDWPTDDDLEALLTSTPLPRSRAVAGWRLWEGWWAALAKSTLTTHLKGARGTGPLAALLSPGSDLPVPPISTVRARLLRGRDVADWGDELVPAVEPLDQALAADLADRLSPVTTQGGRAVADSPAPDVAVVWLR